MLQSIQRGEILIRDLKRESADDQLHTWRFGNNSFVIRFDNSFLALDLQLSYEITSNTPVHPPVADPDNLGMISHALCTQLAPEQFDPPTLLSLKRATAGDLRLVVPRGIRSQVASALMADPPEILPLEVGETVSLGPFDIIAIATYTNTGEQAGLGGSRMLGYAIMVGGFRVFYCSQTIWYVGLTETLKKLGSFDLMLLPIGHEGGSAAASANLRGDEAASLAKICGCGIVVPHHFDQFATVLASPRGFEEACTRLGQDYQILSVGERLSVERASFIPG